jgi:YfiH family protein
MIEVSVPGPVPRFELPDWRQRFRVVAGLTGQGGSPGFNLGLAGATTPVGVVMDRWQAFRAALPGFSAVVVSRQVHGSEILWQDGGRGLVIHAGADGHATDRTGQLLAVTVADCIPVYLVDPTRRAIALLHAGWRGTAAGILRAGIALLVSRGTQIDDLLMHCGVGICGPCYEVGSEVFLGCGMAVPHSGRGPLDLRALLAKQASELGIRNVSISQFCSRHDGELFFSHRGSGGGEGRMVAYLGLLP